MKNAHWRSRYEQSRRQGSPRRQLSQLRYVPRALRLVWAATSGWTLASTLLLVLQGLLPVATVFLTREVVNALVSIVDSGGDVDAVQKALPIMVAIAAVILAKEILGSAQSYVRLLLAERTQDHMSNLIHDKAISLDLEFYESPQHYDLLQRASVDAIDRPLGLLESLNSLLQNSITLVAMSGVLLTFVWWMPLILLFGTLPALWATMHSTIAFHRWRLDNTENQRRLLYHHRSLVSGELAAELRIFDLGVYFKQAHSQLRKRLRSSRMALMQDQLKAQLLASLFGLLTLAATFGWVAWQALNGLFRLGDLAMFWQAMNQGQQLMRGLLTGAGEIYRNMLFLEDLFTYLDLKPSLADPADPAPMTPGLTQGITLNDVTFTYPGSETTALKNYSLTIPAGKIVAIMGENGAGKSTLLKLLCRFYDPQQGAITWDGVDLRAVAQADLRRRITVLFQRPSVYHDSAADNIRFGDLASQPSLADIETAARSAGADEIITKLPRGYQTILGRWFGTAELSVGEWQRVALARAFVRKADLVILDEPTSAMDSWAENAWMGRFRQLVSGRTALIISHRFSTAMQADMIHVMVDGKIIESGTHAELVARSGRYAQSWRQQIREVREEADPPTPDRHSAQPEATPTP